MKKRICSIFLLLTLLLALLPLQANAVTAGMAALDMQEISRTEYQISKDVKEYEWLLNNGSLTKQMVGHVMEVKVGKDSTATLAAGYSDYNIDDIKNNQWAMVKTTEQAQANACQVHLNKGFLHAAFPAAIPLDDGSLEGHALEPRHVERDVAGGRGEIPVVVTAAVALTGLAALIAGRLRQGLRLLFQQLVQGFLHAAANQFLELPLDNFLIQLYNFLGHSLLAPFRMVCRDFILPEPANYVFFYAFFNLRNLLYIICTFRYF